MPIYEYECANCHHHFDIIQKISDEPIKECPSCHQDSVTKLISAAGFQLKGNGWYVTDFKNKNTNSAPVSTVDSSSKTTSTSSSDSAKKSTGISE